MYDHQYAYDDALDRIDKFIDLLKELGINIPNETKLEECFTASIKVVDRFNKGEIKSLESSTFKEYCQFTGLLNMEEWINRGKGHASFLRLRKHLELLGDSQFIQSLKASDDNSRKVFEAVISLNLLPFVDELEVDDPEDSSQGKQNSGKKPDIRFRFQEKWYAIECKYVTSLNIEGIFKKITDAAEQITEYKNEKYEIEFGIPFLNASGQGFNDGLFNEIPYANHIIPHGLFSHAFNATYSQLKDERFKNEIKAEKYSKCVQGFGVFVNYLTKVHWGVDKYAITDIKTSHEVVLNSDYRTEMAQRIIQEIGHQAQMQNYKLHKW
jgi:hypothetical protein